MAKATKSVKRSKGSRKQSPFPIGADAKTFISMIKEAQEARLMMAMFGSPDAKRSAADEKRRVAYREKWESLSRELRVLGDAVAERFRLDPKGATAEDVLTLSLAAYNSKEAQNAVCSAVVRVSGLSVPGVV